MTGHRIPGVAASAGPTRVAGFTAVGALVLLLAVALLRGPCGYRPIRGSAR